MQLFTLASRTTYVVPSIALFLTLACVGAGCRSAPAPPAVAVTDNTWAVVNGREITRDFVEKAYRRVGGAAPGLSEEEALTAKLSLLNEIVVHELLLARAGELKIDLPDSELDTAYAQAKKNMSEEAFQQELTRRNLTATDMREGLRRELLSEKVMEREVQSKIAVTDKDVSDFFAARDHSDARSTARESLRRRCGNATGGGGEGQDADGTSQGRRTVHRTRDGLFGGS